jgi:hypothetical protein
MISFPLLFRVVLIVALCIQPIVYGESMSDDVSTNIAAIEASGGRIQIDPSEPKRPTALFIEQSLAGDQILSEAVACPTLSRVCLRDSTVTDAGVRELLKLPQLSDLTLVGQAFDDHTCRILSVLSLQRIALERTKISDEGAASLDGKKLINVCLIGHTFTDKALALCRQSTHLDKLVFDSPQITGKGLQNIETSRKAITEVIARGSGITDDGISAMPACPSLTFLDLTRTGIGDGAVAMLANQGGLHNLVLTGCRISDAQVSFLKRLGQLACLDLGGTRIGNESLVTIGEMASLRRVCLDETAISSRGTRALAGSNIEWLSVGDTRIDDRAMIDIASMKNLKWISLAGCKISDAAGDTLVRMQKLEMLDLSRTLITDKVLSSIGKMSSIKLVILNDTKLSSEAVQANRDQSNVEYVYNQHGR